jgi:inner membrane protein involved in colicin E2 resistance
LAEIWRFVVAFGLASGLYALIYELMRLEDDALLVGA